MLVTRPVGRIVGLNPSLAFRSTCGFYANQMKNLWLTVFSECTSHQLCSTKLLIAVKTQNAPKSIDLNVIICADSPYLGGA